MSDPFIGHLTFLRVYSGVMASGSSVLNATKGVKERIGRLLKMHANKREEINEAYAGDIVALVGLKNTTTGDTLADERDPVVLETLHIPQPVIDIAIEPATKADQDKLGQSLAQDRRGRPVVPGPQRHRHRPDHHLRAWGNSTWRSSWTA